MEHVGSKVTFLEGETIFPSGFGHRHLYVVLSGRIEVQTDDGVVQVVGPGDVFGEHVARHTNFALAVTDAELLTIAS